MNRYTKIIMVVGVFTVTLFAIGAIEHTPQDNSDSYTLEHKLAVISNGHYVPKDHVDVLAFRLILNRLDGECPESKEQIADMILKVQEMYQERSGRVATVLWIAKQLNGSVPNGSNKAIKFSEIGGAWLLLATQ